MKAPNKDDGIGSRQTPDHYWQPGSPILIRHLFRGRVRYAHPVTVVQDAPERLILFLRAGTVVKFSDIDFASGTFDGPYDHTWHSTDVLKLLEPGSNHGVSLMWEAGGGPLKCWYIDLQDSFRRTSDGIVTWDRSLDIVVTPDLQWRWKDEDHFESIQELGWITSEEGAALRAEGERVIERIERRDPPFCEPWPDWRPDADWLIPTLPDDWAEF